MLHTTSEREREKKKKREQKRECLKETPNGGWVGPKSESSSAGSMGEGRIPREVEGFGIFRGIEMNLGEGEEEEGLLILLIWDFVIDTTTAIPSVTLYTLLTTCTSLIPSIT